MKETPRQIQTVYLTLLLLNTLAASFIWGINTIFLLDAGLSNTQAFLANAFFTLGQVIFEVPTGIVADTWGRRTSYMLGTITLAISTLLYLYAWQTHAAFWVWAATSMFLGLGFTFFSGATEAWLVDALEFTKFKGTLESVFAKGQIISGIAMLVGSVGGGIIAQNTTLGVPYILRALVLGITFLVAFVFMKDLGFTPTRSKDLVGDVKKTFTTSINLSFKNPAIRWMTLAAPFTTGVSFYAFYAMQPYLLNLYGDQKAYGIAGLAAAIVAGAQIVGGLTVPHLQKLFKRRTSIIFAALGLNVLLLAILSMVTSFWVAIVLLVVWGLLFSATFPVRQAYMNGLIPSQQRATVLSFDALVGSSGGVVVQPVLGKVADLWSYPASYFGAALFQSLALPFVFLARREKPQSDTITQSKK